MKDERYTINEIAASTCAASPGRMRNTKCCIGIGIVLVFDLRYMRELKKED